jgi:tetratricopeptide (TPR) repeat protein
VGGAEDQNAATEPARERAATGDPGAFIDRYVTVSELGAGAMGRVYLAVDPELDRRVAIKLLRRAADGSGDLDLRLRREAQALAKLSHPNVATIYDVGEVGGGLFLAMEYVGGGTLTAWLREPRPWQDVVRVFAGAGRGLAAVHARGLVHRDFKPDNVLLDERLVAKVTDFGLVATHDEAPASELGAAEGLDVFGSLTVTGAILGTPAYMAPEQLAGSVADARSDQFSFCVALYEALYRVRPFAGGTVGALRVALEQPPAEPTADQRRRVPCWLHDVILRGLAREPVARFSTMDEVVDALDHERRERRRRRRRRAMIATPALGAVLAGAVAIAVARGGGSDAPACGDPDAELAPAWNPARRAAIEAAFGTTKLGAGAAAGVVARLDDYAARWRASHRDACAATHERHTQTATAMDLRMACLARHRRALTAYVDEVAGGASELVEHAVDAAAALPAIAECDDVASLTGVAAPPAAARAAIEAARAELIRAEVWIQSGMFTTAQTVIDAQLATADQLGYAPLQAEVLITRGELEDARSEFAASAATYRLAAAAADRGRDDRTRFEAIVGQIAATTAAADLAGAEAQLPTAEAALTRAGTDLSLAERWDTVRARIDYLRGRLPEAIARFEAAIARARAAGDKHATGLLLLQLALATLDAVGPAKARPAAEESVALAVAEYGDRHPEVGRREQALARALLYAGDVEGARKLLDHARGLLVAMYGEDHRDVASIDLIRAAMARRAGKLDEARALLERNVAVLRAQLGPQHFWVADALLGLALVERRAGKPELALALLDEARGILESTLGGKTDGLVAAYHTKGAILRDLGRLDDAAAAFAAGVALSEEIAPGNQRLALFYAEMGSLDVERKQYAAAERALERALAVYGDGPADDVAYMRLDLARAKRGLAKWPEVLELATAARPGITEAADVRATDALIAEAKRRAR